MKHLYRRRVLAALILAAPLVGIAQAAEPIPSPASTLAIGLDRQIRWDNARQLAVQDDQRNKTLDSFAREKMMAMTGRDHLPGLSPMASLFEWLFNWRAYADEPLVYVKDKGLRIEFGLILPPSDRDYVTRTGRFSLRQIADRAIAARIDELEPRFEMVTAIRRVNEARFVAFNLSEMLRIVPAASGDPDAAWHRPEQLIDNLDPEALEQMGLSLSDQRQPVEGIDAAQARTVLVAWSKLKFAWLAGDATSVQQSLDQLTVTLPAIAGPDVYPSASQRAAETRYYAMGKFTWGWMLYFTAALAGFWALITRWRLPWLLAAGLLLIAMGLHAYGIALRWHILGRIPVANMFEAVVSSAWAGIALAFVLEMIYRTRVFMFAGGVAGFLALILGGYVIPGHGTLTSIMGILDDVMLRIHTVLIIWSYALIFIASVIAVVYLFQYYLNRAPGSSLFMGVATAICGGLLVVGTSWLFVGTPDGVDTIKHPGVATTAGVIVVALLALIFALASRARPGTPLALATLTAVAVSIVFVGNHAFVWGAGLSLLLAGLVWAALTGAGILVPLVQSRLAMATSRAPAMATNIGAAISTDIGPMRRPVLAGALPGDESRKKDLPAWLNQLDWCHLIILNMVFVMLFVGLILGAVWADYSWGRPWGWDPKEVFAMNTWLIYAILIHARFIVKARGLWTAWLSVIGCLMMAFNWCFVNFFIVGLHSYA